MDENPTPTLESLAAEVARLSGLVAELRGPGASPDPRPAEAGPGAEGAGARLDRRAVLRRAGGMAAAAVAGGAALVATSATPAAAATVNGSGNPGVIGDGLGGDGVRGATNTSGASGVYASTATAGAYGLFARHTGAGNALAVEGTTNGEVSPSTVKVRNLGTGVGMTVLTRGLATALYGQGEDGFSTLYVSKSGGSGDVVQVVSTGSGGNGITVGGANVAFNSGNANIGVRCLADLVGAILQAPTQLSLRGPATVPTGRSTPGNGGDLVFDGTDLWLCTVSGTPGTWRKVAGKNGAGAFHVLPAPARVYDSRPGSTPAVGSKTKLAPNVARTLDLKAGASGVPAGATAALLTILLVNAANASANFTVWANGVARPTANTMVWGGATGRFTASAVSALDPLARVQVVASASTDLVVDVVGYYR